jgi:1-deoxy-D-xylulose-5-phosphate synthase
MGSGEAKVVLETIRQPSDIKSLSMDQLDGLAEDIRQFLITKLSVTGGHLASNLGIVELTLAMHYIFDSPKDKFIFDVGHQSYVHKILTGRMDQFDQLRQYKGLCGFIKRNESEHDVWEAGHSSTSLSAAMGMAVARDAKGEDNHVVAVIGDGAMTGGMALEAMNHIGHEKRKLIVVLNDNEMSIAPNVGAIHNYLGRIRSDRHYVKAKVEVDHLIKKIPAIGDKLARTAEKFKDGLKYLMVPGVWFEELGFTYFGPVDGHNFQQLFEAFQQADKVQGPTLVHVVTMKGKGYTPAETDSHKWHGISPYKIESGQVIKGAEAPPMYTEVFGNTLIELANKDNRIIAITPAMPGGSGLMKFADLFPERMIDVGIAEQHAATFCGALAIEEMKPVFAVYSTFLQRAYDQVVHDICRQNLNVFMAIDRAGFVGADGETHQGVYDIAFLRHIPNMVLMMPKDENELRHMMATGIAYNEGPIAVRYPRMNGLGVAYDEQMQPIPIGTWEVLKEGKDATVLAIGPMIPIARQAAEQLAAEGIQIEVVNARFIKPLDDLMLQRIAAKQQPVITMEEACLSGGFGSSILEWYVSKGLRIPPFHAMGVPDEYIEHGSVKDQRREVGLTVEHLVEHVHTLRSVK